MVEIHVNRGLLFTTVLCLLWIQRSSLDAPKWATVSRRRPEVQSAVCRRNTPILPNYCDIGENGGDIQTIKAHKVIPSDFSSSENVPSQQEKEKPVEQLLSHSNTAQPNVEYVNSIETQNAVNDRDDLQNSQTIVQSQTLIDIKQETFKNLDSSKANSITAKEEILIKLKKSTEPKYEVPLSPPKEVLEPSPPPVLKPPSDPKPEASPVAASPVMESAAPHYDGMPSFDEWKRMMLAQQQKGGAQVANPTPAGKKLGGRRRNYSSYECGAKIVGANTESEGSSRVLNELVDDYMLNPCTAKIWFVIELCETVQATQIELANFELFSSSPKSFSVWSSDHYPSRDWLLLGSFVAAEQRVLQGFPLKQEGFGKFIKIELDGHYGREHYCPLSVVRIFGTSMVDEYEEMETLASQPVIADDELDRLDFPLEDKKDKKTTNIFGSATDAVMNIVKKAAEALGKHQPSGDNKNGTIEEQQNISEVKHCRVTDNVSDRCATSSESVVTPPTLTTFAVPPVWKRQSLSRLLRRCDSCALSPHSIRYHSAAQPHCRFFQAAFGPVAFRALCDWLREHPFTHLAHLDSGGRPSSSSSSSSAEAPTRSPPPQVIQIPIERNDSVVTVIVDPNADDASVVVNTSEVPGHFADQSSSGTEEAIAKLVDPSLVEMPSVDVPTGEHNSSKEFPSPNEVQSVPLPNEISEEASTKAPHEETSTILPRPSEEAADTSTTVDSTMELFTDSPDREQELMSGTVSPEDMTLTEMNPMTELPPRRVEGKLDSIAGAMPTAGQKESVFMRMSNRIRSLEINMSLSSQYLQELSQRYRKQMDDMQRTYNRTIGALNESAWKAAEKDLRQQEILNNLQVQVGNLTQIVELLVNERSSVFRQMIETHICLMLMEAILMVTILSLCVRRINNARTHELPFASPAVEPVRLTKRRSSVDLSQPTPPAKRIQRMSTSEEALHKDEDFLNADTLPESIEPLLKAARKKNKKRNRAVRRSLSNPVPLTTKLSTRPTQTHTSQSECNVSSSGGSTNRLQLHSHPCENCNKHDCRTADANGASQKTKRANGVVSPLRNLTNGSAVHFQNSSPRADRSKDRFSFRKFLKFQKRDSI